MARNKDDDGIDLNDPETRRMLHDPKAVRSESVKAGVVAGGVGAVVAASQSVFMVPEFVKKFNKIDPAVKFSERLLSTAKGNKLLTALVAAPVIAAIAVGTWGYLSARSHFGKKEKQLAALEQKEARSAPLPDAREPLQEEQLGDSGPSWVERTQARKLSGARLR